MTTRITLWFDLHGEPVFQIDSGHDPEAQRAEVDDWLARYVRRHPPLPGIDLMPQHGHHEIPPEAHGAV